MKSLKLKRPVFALNVVGPSNDENEFVVGTSSEDGAALQLGGAIMADDKGRMVIPGDFGIKGGLYFGDSEEPFDPSAGGGGGAVYAHSISLWGDGIHYTTVLYSSSAEAFTLDTYDQAEDIFNDTYGYGYIEGNDGAMYTSISADPSNHAIFVRVIGSGADIEINPINWGTQYQAVDYQIIER